MELKKNIMQNKRPRNEKGQRHGKWVAYYNQNQVSKPNEFYYMEVNYVNDEPYGCMECFGFGAQKEGYEYYAR